MIGLVLLPVESKSMIVFMQVWPGFVLHQYESEIYNLEIGEIHAHINRRVREN